MKYRIQSALYHMTIILEAVIGVFLILGVVFSIAGLAYSLDFVHLVQTPSHITTYLSLVATIVLSIEFTKMLCTHSLDSVVEVLSMAIAREIIAHETTLAQNLIGVIAIAILFLVRKHCYVSKLDKHESSRRSLARDTLHDFMHRSKPGESGEPDESGEKALSEAAD